MGFNESRFDSVVRGLCDEIGWLENELRAARKEVELYKEENERLVTNSVAHSQAVMGNTLKMLLTPGVNEALINGGFK